MDFSFLLPKKLLLIKRSNNVRTITNLSFRGYFCLLCRVLFLNLDALKGSYLNQICV